MESGAVSNASSSHDEGSASLRSTWKCHFQGLWETESMKKFGFVFLVFNAHCTICSSVYIDVFLIHSIIQQTLTAYLLLSGRMDRQMAFASLPVTSHCSTTVDAVSQPFQASSFSSVCLTCSVSPVVANLHV